MSDFSRSGFNWQVVTTDTQMQPGNGYIVDSGSLVKLTMPAVIGANQQVAVAGFGSGGWKIVQKAGQTIHINGSNSTTGAGNGFASQARFDGVTLLCANANTDFVASSFNGNPAPFTVAGGVYIASSTGSLPGVKIQGSTFMTITNNPSLFGVHVSFFLVWKVKNSSGSTWMLEKGGGGDTGSWLFGATYPDGSNDNKISFYSTANGVQTISSFLPTNQTGYQQTMIYDGVGAKYRHNGIADTTNPDDSGDLQDNGGNIILGGMNNYGGTSNFEFTLSEILFFNTDVSSINRDLIEGYLLNKYGLGSGAPFDPTLVSGLQFWLKADALVGYSDGDIVGTWPDSSGNGNDANG